jgi:hypothetical protein
VSSEAKEWYHHVTSGQRGWLVEKDGEKFIRIDNPRDPSLRPFSPSTWILDRDIRPLLRHHCAEVAFVACMRLRRVLGDASFRKEWRDLTTEKRIEFAKQGLSDDPEIAHRIRELIMRELEPLSKQ